MMKQMFLTPRCAAFDKYRSGRPPLPHPSPSLRHWGHRKLWAAFIARQRWYDCVCPRLVLWTTSALRCREPRRLPACVYICL